MRGHWRFSILGQNGKPAATTVLNELYKDKSSTKADGLDISYLQILDNNEMAFQLAPGQTRLIKKNEFAAFRAQSIYSGPDFIEVSGALDIGAPRVGDIKLDLKYTKPGNAQVLDFSKVELDFISKGFVHFEADRTIGKNIEITATEVKITGEVYEKPNTFNNMPATLIAKSGNPQYTIEVEKDWITQLSVETGNVANARANFQNNAGGKGTRLQIANGGTTASKGGDWNIFTFEGKMKENDPNNNAYKEEPHMIFTVTGAVKATADKEGIKLNGGAFFGGFNVFYDFEKMALMGSLELNATPTITIAPVTLQNGALEFRCDPNGFYIAGAVKAYVASIPVIGGTYNLGFMAGYYPDFENRMQNEIWPLVTRYKNPLWKNDCYPNYINNNLKGFYLTLDHDIFNTRADVNFGVIWGGIKAYAGMGADIYMNFGQRTVFGVSARAKLLVDAYLGAVTGTSIEGSLKADAAFDFGYEEPNFTINFSADASFKAKVQQWLIFDTVTLFNETVNCRIEAGTKTGFDFTLDSGAPRFQCPPAFR
jgi:hypothetical protein